MIHAQKADRKGNVLFGGIVGVQKEAALAARRAIVTVEEIVDRLDPRANSVVLPWVMSAVAPCPGRGSVLCARLLRSRQCLLLAMGRDRARARSFTLGRYGT